MATKSTAPLALFLSFNLLMFSVLSDCGSSCTTPNVQACPQPPPAVLRPPPPPTIFFPPPPPPAILFPPPPPPTIPSPSNGLTCPINILELGVCANVLGGVLGPIIGTAPYDQCCPLIQGLVDLDAAVCLCLALRANILGINLNLDLALQLLLNLCSINVPVGFRCA